MSEIHWDEIENGFRIILGFQLLIIAIIHIFNSRKSNVPLGILTLMVALFFFWKWLLPIFNSSLLGRGFLLLNRELFIPPLLYLVLLQTHKSLVLKDYLRHLSIPLIFVVICQFIIITNYEEINVQLVANSVSMFPVILMLAVYFFLGKKKLEAIKDKLISKAFKKYRLLFYVIIINYANMYLQGILSYFIQYRILLTHYGDMPSGKVYTNTEYDWVNALGWFFNGPFEWYNLYICYPLIYLTPIFIIVFGLSEIPYFKLLFLPKNIAHDEKIIASGKSLIDKLEIYFKTEKPFLDSSFNIEICCRNLKCSKKELQESLTFYLNQSFKEFVDRKKIQEFKTLATDPKHQIYDISSLAQMAGFNSKATFYRIFKEMEGITPKKYLTENLK